MDRITSKTHCDSRTNEVLLGKTTRISTPGIPGFVTHIQRRCDEVTGRLSSLDAADNSVVIYYKIGIDNRLFLYDYTFESACNAAAGIDQKAKDIIKNNTALMYAIAHVRKTEECEGIRAADHMGWIVDELEAVAEKVKLDKELVDMMRSLRDHFIHH